MRMYVLPATVGLLLRLAGAAVAADTGDPLVEIVETAVYHCLPVEIFEEPDRFSVLCAEPVSKEGGYPLDGGDRIRYFAVPKSDTGKARRFAYLTQTALTAGLVMRFEYTRGDVSGTTFGCASWDCRTPWAFGLLAPASEVRIPAP